LTVARKRNTVNREGLTLTEWLAAAGFSVAKLDEQGQALLKAWDAGEDPTEYRGSEWSDARGRFERKA
jgi:alpha-beta hydrolase superfamily lysophospholipase